MIQGIAIINEKNDRTFTRIYRLAATFGVPRIYAVDCPAKLRGNLFSATGKVEVERHDIESFEWLHALTNPFYIECHPRRGDAMLRVAPDEDIILLCNCNRTRPPHWVRERLAARFHVPSPGVDLELCTDQAVAIALYALSLNE